MPTVRRTRRTSEVAMGRLIALDRPGGSGFVRDLERIWHDGDAAFPVDQRLPHRAKRALLDAMAVGEEVEDGDALVVATSGSTGTPKGVVLTHDAVDASARATSERLEVTADDHWLACLPLSHVGGLSVVTRSLVVGTRLTVHPSFDPEAATQSGATLVSLVATALRRVDPSVFRTIVLGGGRPPADRPANTVTTYGMTETGSGVVYDGRPLEGVEIEMRDGEIHLRGPMLLRAYRDGTPALDDAGWLATGDVGRWSPDGRLHVEGRRGDLIITGGENVWPELVEQCLRTHPDVAEVMVRGVDDREWGQVVEAVVVPRAGTAPTLSELRDHVKASHAPFVAPRRLALVAGLPVTSLGKPQRHAALPPDAVATSC